MNQAKVDTPSTLQAVFRSAAARFGDVEAVRYRHEGVTYAALDRMSDAIARSLRAAGVLPSEVVALKAAKSLRLPAALLGILKAGAAVLPLDTSYPEELVSYMLGVARAARTVDDAFVERALGDGRTDADLPNAEDAETALCYVLFTSGSTGRPKGVAMPHRAIVNLARWHQRTIPLRPGSRVLQFAPLSFDVSFQEYFTTWADGGTMVLIDQETRQEPRALWRVIDEESIERVFLPYVALQMLAESAPGEVPGSLREVITAGEALRVTPQIRALFSRMPECRLHNHYGPTETHVCTAHTLAGASDVWPLLPPIGKPIDGATLLILDGEKKRAKSGELFVAGPCVGAGYIGRDDLTEERFQMIDGDRYYRTGDLVHLREDGELEFAGRADDQIKVRGFRVEPGEIEAQLSEHPAVRQCAVVARAQRLAAFWVGEPVEARELREFLAGRLAAHLVPSSYTRVVDMPVTPSGKIDRRRLPEVVAGSEPAGAALPERASEMESRVSRIWGEALSTPVSDLDANFFDLGGTSLSAIAAQQLLGSELRRELPVTLLFQYPTIRALARHLESGPTAGLSGQVLSRAAAQRAALSRQRPPLART